MESKTTVMGSEEAFILSTMHALWKNRCLSIIVGLKIPELLCAEQCSVSIEDIAKKSGCASSKGLYPVMKVLAQWGIGKELENKHFAKNRGMELLRRDKESSLGHAVEYFCSEEYLSAMRSLAACVKHGQSAFVLEHGMNHYEYMNGIENHPYCKTKIFKGSSEHLIGSDNRRRQFVDNYARAMDCYNHLSILPDVQGVNNVFEAFPWSTCKRLLDMGGCSGNFLASILKLPGCEATQGYVLDLPNVIDDAQKNAERRLGIPEHRMEFIKHDFTQPIPSNLHQQVDTVVFKNALSMYMHDHEMVTKILLNCRSLFPSQGGRILVINFCVMDLGNIENNVGINGIELGAYSIHYLSASGSRLQSRSEWITNLQEIGNKAGYQLTQVYDTFPGGLTIFELSPSNIST